MQPVTIKNNLYSHTLWLSQAGLALLAVVILWMGISNYPWLLLLLVLVVMAWIKNHKTITQQSKLQFAMRANGQLVVMNHHDVNSTTETTGNLSIDDKMDVEIKAFWHLPHILMLKLSVKNLNKPVYITLFRSVIGASDFSHLLVGLTQLNNAQKTNHEY